MAARTSITSPSRRARRVMLCLALACLGPLVLLTSAPSSGEEPSSGDIVVTLLGTGTPAPSPTRFSQSTLVQAGGLNLVIDAGRGASIRLTQAGVGLGDVDGVFLTHFHSDHVVGLDDLWMTGYIPVLNGRTAPLQLYGPVGTKHIGDGLMKTFRADTRIREADEDVSPAAARIESHEFDREGVVFERSGVRVTAFEVNHGELIKPSVGYRIDYAGRSVVISGDTKFDPNVIEHSRGVDVLIHEVGAGPPELEAAPEWQPVLGHHTYPEEAGRVFSEARPRLAVYSHLVLIRTATVPPISLETLAARTRTTYDGPLTIGEDLMRIVVGDEIEVVPPPAP